MRKNRGEEGITLIALIVTTIILIILASITIYSITSNKVIERAKKGAEIHDEKQKEELDLFNKVDNIIDSQLVSDGSKQEVIKPVSENDGLIGKVANINKSGIQNIEVNDVTYSTNVIIYNGDLILDGAKTVVGSTLENNIYEFGNKETDVAKGTEYAKNMVILKVNGNLTINEGVTVTSCKSDEGLGGAKGLLIYCEGNLTNNGTISMTARGAKAEGQNVYLWQNEDKSYEYVPAEGGAGATSASAYGGTWNPSGWYYGTAKGNDAPKALGRALAGGGSGSAYVSNQYTVKSQVGAKATSYSGGSGSGATFSAKASITGYSAEEKGGKGGNGYVDENSGYSNSGGGGAGNPGGFGYISKGVLNQVKSPEFDGINGTRRVTHNIC